MNTTMTANKIRPEQRSSYSLALMVFAGIVVFGALMASLSPKQNDIPVELRGVWKTDEANHSDRFLDLSLVSVSFGTGNGTVSTGFIRNVAIVPQGPRTLYTITYRDEEGDRELSFIYQPDSATLQIKNQSRVVWRKRQDN
jgi:hypothetical protein